MNKEKIYNNLTEISLINLYTLSKSEKKIKLKNFDFKNKNHLFLLNISKILNVLYGYDIFIETTLLQYIKYKIRTRHNIIHRKSKMQNGINIDDFLNHIADAQKVNRNIWEAIFNEFYGGKNV